MSKKPCKRPVTIRLAKQFYANMICASVYRHVDNSLVNTSRYYTVNLHSLRSGLAVSHLMVNDLGALALLLIRAQEWIDRQECRDFKKQTPKRAKAASVLVEKSR